MMQLVVFPQPCCEDFLQIKRHMQCSLIYRSNANVVAADGTQNCSRGRWPRPRAEPSGVSPERDEDARTQPRCPRRPTLHFPVAKGFVSPHLQTGLALFISFQLLGEPLKPFECLLRSATVPLEFNVPPQFSPNHTDISAHEVVDHSQRHNAFEHRIAESFND